MSHSYETASPESNSLLRLSVQTNGEMQIIALFLAYFSSSPKSKRKWEVGQSQELVLLFPDKFQDKFQLLFKIGDEKCVIPDMAPRWRYF